MTKYLSSSGTLALLFSDIYSFYIFSKLQVFIVSGAKGDSVVQLVPERLPDLSTGSQDQELDVTLDEVAPPLSENTQPDTEQGAGTSEEESLTQGERPLMSKPSEKYKIDFNISHKLAICLLII